MTTSKKTTTKKGSKGKTGRKESLAVQSVKNVELAYNEEHLAEKDYAVKRTAFLAAEDRVLKAKENTKFVNAVHEGIVRGLRK